MSNSKSFFNFTFKLQKCDNEINGKEIASNKEINLSLYINRFNGIAESKTKNTKNYNKIYLITLLLISILKLFNYFYT